MADDTNPATAPDAQDAPKESVAAQLVRLGTDQYELGSTPDGMPYAMPTTGALTVRPLRGGGRRGRSLRAELARLYQAQTGKVATQQALSDALMVLDGQAQLTSAVPLHLRIAEHEGALVLDLGDATGRAVVIRPGEWTTVDLREHFGCRVPVRFRRTALTQPLPDPVRGGSLDLLWQLVHVRQEYRPVLAALLVAALMPRIPHPVLLLTGEQGAAKSSASRMLAATVDPAYPQLRKPPRDEDTWVVGAAGSWVVALDNLSSMPEWLSNALCRAVTDAGDVRKELYSDEELTVISFRRWIILNGIDLGALEDDLSDRLVAVPLDPIEEDARRDDTEVSDQWAAVHAQVLGALLDLTATVLTTLPSVHLQRRPRMADYARVLAAVDCALGTSGLDTYLASRRSLANDAVASVPVLVALRAAVTEEWEGTSAELLRRITPSDSNWTRPKEWPSSARALTAVLTRRAPSLRRTGWIVERAGDDLHNKLVRHRLVPPPELPLRDTGNRQERKIPPDTRNTRDPRTSDFTPGQGCDGTAGVAAGVCGGSAGVAGEDTRSPDNTRTNTRSAAPPATSGNSVHAGVAGVAGTEPVPPLSANDSRALRLVTETFDAVVLHSTETENPR